MRGSKHLSFQVSLLAPPEVSFHYELSFFKSGNTSVNVQPGGKVSYHVRKMWTHSP